MTRSRSPRRRPLPVAVRRSIRRTGRPLGPRRRAQGGVSRLRPRRPAVGNVERRLLGDAQASRQGAGALSCGRVGSGLLGWRSLRFRAFSAGGSLAGLLGHRILLGTGPPQPGSPQPGPLSTGSPRVPDLFGRARSRNAEVQCDGEQQRDDQCDQNHIEAGIGLGAVPVGPRCPAGRAPLLCDGAGTPRADQVVAAHRFPSRGFLVTGEV